MEVAGREILEKRKELMESGIQNSLVIESTLGKSFESVSSVSTKKNIEAAFNFFRRKSFNPDLMEAEDIINGTELSELEKNLEEEIDKFNKMKVLIQKSAKTFYSQESQRIEMQENLKLKEKRIIEIKKKLAGKKEEQRAAMKEKAADKIDAIKRHEELTEEHRKKRAEKTKAKLKAANAKIEIEKEKRVSKKRENELKRIQQFERIQESRLETVNEELDNCKELLNVINDKTQQVTSNHIRILEEKNFDIHKRLELEAFQVAEHREKLRTEEENYLGNLISKLKAKDEARRVKAIQREKEEVERRANRQEKEMNREVTKQKLQEEEKEKLSKMEAKFRQAEENYFFRKFEEERQIVLRQEKNRLKAAEREELLIRQNQLEKAKLHKLLEKKRKVSMKLENKKREQEILFQARLYCFF